MHGNEEKGSPPKENEVQLPGEREWLFSSQKQQMHTSNQAGASKEEEHMFLLGEGPVGQLSGKKRKPERLLLNLPSLCFYPHTLARLL